MEINRLYQLFLMKYGINLEKEIAHGGSGKIYSIVGDEQEVLKVIDVNELADQMAGDDKETKALFREGLLSIYQDELTRNEKLAKTRNGYLVYTSQPYAIVSDDRETCLLAMKMPYYDTLKSLREGGPFSEELTIRVGTQMCEALKVLHYDASGDFYRRKKEKMGIILHMDLKPSNIFYREEHGQKVFKLGDFGATIDKRDGIAHSITEGYNAPETDDEDAILTEHADLFSLGMVLYHCISENEEIESFRALRCEGKVEERPKGCSEQLWEVIVKATEPQIENRFKSAGEMLDALLMVSNTKVKVEEKKKENAQGMAALFAATALLEGAFIVKDKIKNKDKTKGKIGWERNLDYYEGELKDGFPNGKGKYFYVSGKKVKSVSGKWKWVENMDVTTGKKKVMSTYTGMMCDNQYTGFGQIVIPEYGTYQGTIINGEVWNGIFFHLDGREERIENAVPDLDI